MNNDLNAARDAAEPVLPSATLAKEIHHTLWGEICSLKRLPGEKLSEAKLAREYHCSRIPVREAVKQLATEGALEVFPQRGSFISRINVSEVEQTRYLREVLETLKSRGIEKVILYTDSANAKAQACYAKCGFRTAETLTETMSNGKEVPRIRMETRLK